MLDGDEPPRVEVGGGGVALQPGQQPPGHLPMMQFPGERCVCVCVCACVCVCVSSREYKNKVSTESECVFKIRGGCLT